MNAKRIRDTIHRKIEFKKTRDSKEDIKNMLRVELRYMIKNNIKN